MKPPRLVALTIFILAIGGYAQVRVRPEVRPDLHALAKSSASQIEGEIAVPGLLKIVEVLRDDWGIPHIYAQNQHDLFMAQGFVAAQDRLWQMEMWRRTGEGELSEILGPSAIQRDRFARLMRYRGDMDAEWISYSPDAREIIKAFVSGINANIEARKENLPFEFRIMQVKPETWTPEVCLARMAGYIMTRNASGEVQRARLVRELGAKTVQELWPPQPPVDIGIPRGLDLEGIDSSILSGAGGAGSPVNLRNSQGSNNWTVSGELTATGKPILANDPHRSITIPSLRYMCHLIAPGWNVIGAGEPALPGIAAGHNERVAFGFTIVGIDQQDLYVESINPENPLEYRYRGQWKKMEVVKEPLHVRGRQAPEVLELHFTLHGPVIHEDRSRNRAYALRWVGTEPGTAGYLASLSLNRASNWKEFLQALDRWKVPSENLVYADVEGNIGWQATGLTPVRRGWSGLLPVPGTGEYEWQGFLPMTELPRLYNPASGYIATANHNILPPGFRKVLGYEWSSDLRFRRIDEVLRSRKGFSVHDFESLQHDELSIQARELASLLSGVTDRDSHLGDVLRMLRTWDFVLQPRSAEAAIYEMWIQKLFPMVWQKRLPGFDLRSAGGRGLAEAAMRILKNPTSQVFGPDPVTGRNHCLIDALAAAVKELQARLGPDPKAWAWGNLHKAVFLHPLGRDAALRELLDRGPVSRGGDGSTVNATSGGPDFRQTSGASYRQILDLADWDRSIGTNVPGQSGEPGSPHYDDLLPIWSDGKYHPLAFSRSAVEKVTRHRLTLKPKE